MNLEYWSVLIFLNMHDSLDLLIQQSSNFGDWEYHVFHNCYFWVLLTYHETSMIFGGRIHSNTYIDTLSGSSHILVD